MQKAEFPSAVRHGAQTRFRFRAESTGRRARGARSGEGGRQDVKLQPLSGVSVVEELEDEGEDHGEKNGADETDAAGGNEA